MASRRPIKYQLLQIAVSGIGATGSLNANTELLYKRVTGLYVTATDANGLINSTFQKFEINGQEIYPKGFEAKIITTGLEVSPNEKFDSDIDEPAANSVVDIEYKDGGAAGGAYTFNVYLRLENPDEKSILGRNKLVKALFKLLGMLEKEDKA